jgi:outer membrane protein OmpA-like peptidoglycan-associated protein
VQPGSFIDSVKSLITPSLVSNVSTVLDESEATVTKGLGAALSTIFGTLASKADDRPFMSRVFEMVKDPAAETRLLGFPAGESSSTSLSGRFMWALFGRRTDSVDRALSSFTGVTPSKAASLLNLASPLALGYLGKTVRTGGMDIAGLSNMLLTQKNAIIRLVPSSLSSGMGPQLADTTYRTVDTAVRKPAPWRWLAPVLPLLLALWALVWLFDGRSAAGMVSRTLPGGVQLQYPRAAVEGRVLNFIQDPGQGLNREVWFDFDRLRFETNSAVIQPESQAQLNNIAVILKAYPNARVEIGGYPDTSGDPAANLTMAQARTDSVMRELTTLGVSPDQISAQGYGGEHPVVNATEEDRVQNRRVALRVTQK